MNSPKLSTCPSCQQRLRIKQELVGNQVRCPSCRNAFVVQPASPAVKPSPAKAKIPADTTPPNQPAPISSWSANSAAFPVQQPTNTNWQAGAQQKLTASRKKPLSKGMLIGAASLAAVLLVFGGYFGWRLFLRNPEQAQLETQTAVASGARDATQASRENDLSRADFRGSLMDYLPGALEECVVRGAVNKTEGGAIVLKASGSEPFVEFPVVLPEAYQLELSVRRETAGGTLVVCFPHRGFPCCLVIDGKSGSGLSDIDGKSYAYNATNVGGKQFKDDEAQSIQIVSSPDGILVRLNGQKLAEFSGTPEKLSLEPMSLHPNRMFPAVKAANRGNFIIEQAIVQTKGSSLPQAAIPPYPQSEASIKLAEERFGPTSRDVLALAEQLGGYVMFESAHTDGFRSAYGDDQRLRFNVQSRKVTEWREAIPVAMRVVSMAGVDFSPLAEITGAVKISAPATTNWPEAILPSFNPDFRLEILDLHQAEDLTTNVLRNFPLEQISWLSLNHTKLDEDVADSIAAMKSLKLAQLRGVQIGEKNAAALASLPRLEVLHISSNLASDAAIKKLSQSQSIQVLDIANKAKNSTSLTDAALTSIQMMTGLRQLKLNKTGISPAAIARYRQAKPDVELVYTSLKVSAEQRVYVPKSLSPVVNGSKTLEEVRLTDLPTYALAADKRGFTKWYENRKARMERSPKIMKHLIVGHIELEGGADPKLVTSNDEILPDGSFAHIVRDLERPLAVRALGFEPLDIQLTKCQGVVIDLGTIRMKKLSEAKSRTMNLQVQLEGEESPRPAFILLVLSTDSQTVQYATDFRHHQIPITTAEPIRLEGLAAAKYHCFIYAPNNYVHQATNFDLTNRRSVELGEIRLEKSKTIQLEYIVAEDSAGETTFNPSAIEKSVVGGGQNWNVRSGNTGFSLVQADRQLNFRAVFTTSRIKELGRGRLADFLDVPKGADGMSRTLRVQVGHVYLIRAEYLKSYILLQVNENDQTD